MTSDFIPYGRHHIAEEDIEAVVQCLRSTLITQGPIVGNFERALASYIGAEHVSVCANGSMALMLAYAALGLGPGDEIITSPITFAATASAALSLGAMVRFADVDPMTGNITAASVAAQVSSRTRGIVAVHLAGLPADLDELRVVADDCGAWLVDDAAHALGAEYGGQRIGATCADATTFSFHPVKHITTGEGGAVATQRGDVKQALDELRHHGVQRDATLLSRPSPGPWFYEVQRLGWNARLSDMQCALGLSQLRRQPARLAKRRKLAGRYRYRLGQYLAGLVEPQPRGADRESAYHLQIVHVDFAGMNASRRSLMAALHERGIGSQVHYIPLPSHPLFAQRCGPKLGAGAAQYYQSALSLPLYAELEEHHIDRVVDTLEDLAGVRRQRIKEAS